MPLFSMTGFGRREGTLHNQQICLELRSVNNRYLDIFSKLPRHLNYLENSLRQQIRSRLVRGSISLTVSVIGDSANQSPLTYNTRLVENYLQMAEDISRRFKVAGKVELSHILALPDLFSGGDNSITDAHTSEFLQELLDKAIDDLLVMREQEGASLERDLRARVLKMQSLLQEILSLEPMRIVALRDRYLTRLQSLITDREIDPIRLHQEIGKMAERLDISEEITRFGAHCAFFLQTLGEASNQGKKLNFILQEMTREANTLGTKCLDAGISALAVSLKDEVETIREQVQNIQ